MSAVAKLGVLVFAAAATAAGTAPGVPVDQTFSVRRVHVDGLVGQVELLTIPQGPVRVQASGTVDTMKEFHVRAVGDEVVIRLDSDENEAWFPWNLFNMWSRDRRSQDLKVTISAPLGTPYDFDGVVGTINAGDLDAPLRLDGSSVNARFGRVQSANVDVAGSGHIVVGAVKENLDVDMAGSGRFEAASATAAKIDCAGSGRVTIGPLTAGFSADIAGSGDIHVARVNGPVDIDIAGSGNVYIDAGRATSFSVDSAGSGDVVFKGEAVNPKIEIMGSGTVKVGSMSGTLKQDIAGSGEFQIMNPTPPAPVAPPAPPAAPIPPAPPHP